MEKLVDRITRKVSAAFFAAELDADFAKVTVSNRPDLCQFQCNGCLPAAKRLGVPPMTLCERVCGRLAGESMFSAVEAAKPGFLNLTLSPEFLRDYLTEMAQTDRFGLPTDPRARTIVLDYGGPNVAKPLHIGHLRSAIIGESVKRLLRHFGNTVVGDIHLGDWGLQMGLIITELEVRAPELCYFDNAYTGSYPEDAPFTISELEEIYPAASRRSKEDEAYLARAHEATRLLQEGHRGYRALWSDIMAVSLRDLKRNYEHLGVSFDVWLGESDAQPYVPKMLAVVENKGLAHRSYGALVVDVSEAGDTKEYPPCILMKSDGATLYATTDLATILQRAHDFRPDFILYIVDKRQSLHFEQVFRVARKAALIPETTELRHIGFGTMNGSDGKPFKTRAGGVMRLEQLIADVTGYVRGKITENQVVDAAEVEQTARLIAMAALKYGDLSNLATKDYVFDLDRFAAFEGNTGPYILYTIVRIKSILQKYGRTVEHTALLPADCPEATDLMLKISRYSDQMQLAYREVTPNTICAYIYDLSGTVNKFYHEVRILAEPDETIRASRVALMDLARRVLETCIDILGFEAPDRM